MYVKQSIADKIFRNRQPSVAGRAGERAHRKYSTYTPSPLGNPSFLGLVLSCIVHQGQCAVIRYRPICTQRPVSPYLCIVSSMSLWEKEAGSYFFLPAFSPRYLLLPLSLVRFSPSIAGSMIGHRQEHDHGTHTHTHTITHMNRATACLRQDHRPRLWPQKN